MQDISLWIVLSVILGVLWLVLHFNDTRRRHERARHRITPESAGKARDLVLAYLKTLEAKAQGGKPALPAPASAVEHALKTMMACMAEQGQRQDIPRLKQAFLALADFDDRSPAAARRRLDREIEHFLSRLPQ